MHIACTCVGDFCWAARYNTWLLIRLTPEGVVFSFLFHWRLSDGKLERVPLRLICLLSAYHEEALASKGSKFRTHNQ